MRIDESRFSRQQVPDRDARGGEHQRRACSYGCCERFRIHELGLMVTTHAGLRLLSGWMMGAASLLRMATRQRRNGTRVRALCTQQQNGREYQGQNSNAEPEHAVNPHIA